MASLTGGFAPIAGASAKDNGVNIAKKTDLTGGLVSLNGGAGITRAKSDDVDFSDFDVDDLLLDDVTSKNKSKEKSKSPTSPSKKKKSTNSSGKKKKDKKKTSTALELIDDEGDAWDEAGRNKPKDKSKLEDFVPVKKNSRLDDEFARMLGLEEEATNVDARSTTMDDNHGLTEHVDSSFELKDLEVQPSQPSESHRDSKDQSPIRLAGEDRVGGLNALFFQDDAPSNKAAASGSDEGLSFLSSLGSLGEKRGGRGGGRRAGGPGSDSIKPGLVDPFGTTTNVSQRMSGLDDLFSSTPSRVATDSAPQPTKSTFATLFSGSESNDRPNVTEKQEDKSTRTSSVKASPSSAKDDLLAELFPANEPQVATKKYAPVKDEQAQQDDLLAELFPAEPQKAPANMPLVPHAAKSSLDHTNNAAGTNENQPKSTKLSGSSSSPRDNLLEDLLHSPPSPRRGAVAPEVDADGTPKHDSPQPASSVPEPSPPRKESSVKPESLPPTKPEFPVPSPGKTKTLTVGTPSKVREIEFEQSKDDLLEEILSSAATSPSKPNDNVTPVSPRSRHSSYSLSFDQDANAGATQPGEQPPVSVVTPHRRRASRSPEKEPQTVFLRDAHAEEELKRLHAAELAALKERHTEEVRQLESELQRLQSRIVDEERKSQSQMNLCESHTLQLSNLQEQLTTARAECATLSSDFQALQTRHSLQQTQLELFDRERAALLGQLKSVDDQHRAVVSQLTQEKMEHQQAELELATFKREVEQKAQLQSEKERAQMDRLYHQLHNTLAQLTMLQEQNSEDASAKRELEAASRFRMIASLESTSRGYAQQTQDECHRLTSLLSSLETTLRAYRQEHVEEKERLRQEQLRLTVLAEHFQAQTSVLHEKSDANAQILARYLNTSLQDARVAEARLATRRQQLADDEQKLYVERAAFASHREEWLEQQERDCAELKAQRIALDREWRSLHREREDLEDMIASHEDAFGAMKQQQQALEAEKERVAMGALHVAEMAAKFELLTRQLVEKEQTMRDQQRTVEEVQREWAIREKAVEAERMKLLEREGRLHTQLKQMEATRRKLNDERKKQLQRVRDSKTTDATVIGAVRSHTTLGSGMRTRLESTATSSPPRTNLPPSLLALLPQAGPVAEPIPYFSRPVLTKSTKSPVEPMKSSTTDPSGFSPAFRQLVEDNWRKPLHQTKSELVKERMEIHCLGLNTSRRDKSIHLTKQQEPSHSIMPTRTAAHGAGVARMHEAPPPPSEPRTSQPRYLSVHL